MLMCYLDKGKKTLVDNIVFRDNKKFDYGFWLLFV